MHFQSNELINHLKPAHVLLLWLSGEILNLVNYGLSTATFAVTFAYTCFKFYKDFKNHKTNKK